MLNLQTSAQSCGHSHLVFQKSWINLQSGKSPLLLLGRAIGNQKKHKGVRVRCSSSGADVKAVAAVGGNTVTKVKVTLTVLRTVGGYFSELGVQRGLDDIKELLGQSLQVELVSAELEHS